MKTRSPVSNGWVTKRKMIESKALPAADLKMNERPMRSV